MREKLPTNFKNRYWIQEYHSLYGNSYVLYFDVFENEEILKFVKPKTGNEYFYTSELLNVEHDSIEADSIEEAMEMFEQMISDYLGEQCNYYEELLKIFEESK